MPVDTRPSPVDPSAPGVWPELFDLYDRHNPALLADWWACVLPVVKWITTHIPPPARLLEIGCGGGHCTALFAMHGYRVDAWDTDLTMLQRAQALCGRLYLPANFALCDKDWESPVVTQPYDLVFTGGLLEHFQPPRQRQMLHKLGYLARTVVTYVPTRFGVENDPEGFDEIVPIWPMTRRSLLARHREVGYRQIRLAGWGDADRRVLRGLLPGAAWWALRRSGLLSCTLCTIAQSPWRA